jgi:LPXTG-motif cell wall-anchored protein
MRAGLERNFVRRALGALLLSGVLLVAGATAAAAGGYGSDGSDCSECPTPPPSTTPPSPTTPPAVTTPTHHAPTYPVPSVPPGTPHTPPSSPPPSVSLPRTGSNTGTLAGLGAGALAVGGGLVVLARRRRLAVLPS